MNKRIILAVSNDLVTDQRVLRVSNTLISNSYDVKLIGRKLKNSFVFTANIPHKRMKLCFNTGFLFYAELNIRLFFSLLFSKVDIIYANDTDTVLACFLASKIRRKKLIFDAHELFPEVPELQHRPKVKAIWEHLENWIFPQLTTSFTVCQSIADYYNQKYKIDMGVVRNLPKLQDIPPKRLHFKDKKIILYQGAINIGRGLEWVIDAMPYIDDAMLYIIGDGDIKADLEQKVNEMELGDKVIFHGRVAADELASYTSSGDIGLCLLENRGLSYYYSLPNRVFTYMHAGVPILASPFPEIKAIVEKEQTGVLTEETDPRKLADVINQMLQHPLDTRHFEDLKKRYCWEEEENILLKIVETC